ncbi:MAG: sigma-70 factor domain-containing protein, partial [Mycobacterium sp.]
MAATKATPATDEPLKPTAAKRPAKKAAPAKSANGSAPAKKAAKRTATKAAKARATKATGAPASRSRAKKAVAAAPEPAGKDLAVDGAEIDLADIAVSEQGGASDADSGAKAAAGKPKKGAGAKAKTARKTSGKSAKSSAAADDGIAEPSEKDKASGDFVWDEEESEALRQARKDAELTASADSVRAYLKQIGKVALLNAEEEVELAKRIEAGLYAVQLTEQKAAKGEKFTPTERRDMSWICRDGDRAKNHLLEANLR